MKAVDFNNRWAGVWLWLSTAWLPLDTSQRQVRLARPFTTSPVTVALSLDIGPPISKLSLASVTHIGGAVSTERLSSCACCHWSSPASHRPSPSQSSAGNCAVQRAVAVASTGAGSSEAGGASAAMARSASVLNTSDAWHPA